MENAPKRPPGRPPKPKGEKFKQIAVRYPQSDIDRLFAAVPRNRAAFIRTWTMKGVALIEKTASVSKKPRQ